MTAKPRNPSTKGKRSFEQAISEIEEIVARLEGGKLELAQSLDEYQRGIGTLKECYELLTSAERRITLLSGFDANGNAVTEPFDEQTMSTEEKQVARAKRRSAPKQTDLMPDGGDGGASDYFDGEDSQEGLF